MALTKEPLSVKDKAHKVLDELLEEMERSQSTGNIAVTVHLHKGDARTVEDNRIRK